MVLTFDESQHGGGSHVATLNEPGVGDNQDDDEAYPRRQVPASHHDKTLGLVYNMQRRS
jgi:hypothetical protein